MKRGSLQSWRDVLRFFLPWYLLRDGTRSKGFRGRRLAGLLRVIAAIGRKPRDGGCTTSPQRLYRRVVGCILAVLTCITPLGTALAATTAIAAGDLTIRVNETGRIVALIGSDGNDYLAPGYTPPLLKLIVTDSPSDPSLWRRELLPIGYDPPTTAGSREHVLRFDGGAEARIVVEDRGGYVTLSLSEYSAVDLDVRAAMWGPYELSIGQQVADVAGIAYSRDFAIGIQALTTRTFAGTPFEFADKSYGTSVVGNVAGQASFAVDTKTPTRFGSVPGSVSFTKVKLQDGSGNTALTLSQSAVANATNLPEVNIRSSEAHPTNGPFHRDAPVYGVGDGADSRGSYGEPRYGVEFLGAGGDLHGDCDAG